MNPISLGTLAIFSVASFGIAACETSDSNGPSAARTPEPGPAAGTGTVNGQPPSLAAAPAPPISLAINVAANDAVAPSPFDATPSPDGTSVYFTALTGDPSARVPGVFRVPAAGGPIETIASGAPLGAPLGITVSLDGTTLFVADPGAANGGAIFSIPTAGGTPAMLGGTAGYYPGGVVVAKVNDQESVYLTGRDPTSGAPGLFMAAEAGGGVTMVAEGAPFAEPGGVVVAKDGTAYVADSLASGDLAAIVKVSGGAASLLVARIGVGFPAGVTLTEDESTLLVSGLDPVTRTDLVYFADVKSGEISRLTDPIRAFHDSAGLHRAAGANVFAWADSRANTTGTVYVLKQ